MTTPQPATRTPLPDIAKQCPMIQDLFHPDRIDEQIERVMKLKYTKLSPDMIERNKKELAIFLDYKKHLNGEITLEEYNELHQLTDLA